ncbi:MAG: 2,3-bisphosphoglycerate-independent phosphoglycerate mutase [Thermoplasmata archaeon]|nr:2,3-bisphosphoglycerate-independent phosphoglycerate mutase [Thermoplasmata archaeon]
MAPPGEGNAISLANTPAYNHLAMRWPNGALVACGPAVGLPRDQMGNSEVGHMTIGAGRILMQPLSRVNEAITTHDLDVAPAIRTILDDRDGGLHLLCLLSDGGVHSHQDHLFHLMSLAHDRGIDPWLHIFLDGRDTPPRSAPLYLRGLEARMRLHGGRVATMAGRYYAMDRDTRWDRTRRAYDAIVHGKGIPAPHWSRALEAAYSTGEMDEFVIPTVMEGYTGMDDGDRVLMCNFRPDRIRQISEALTAPGFTGFDVADRPVIRFSSLMFISKAVNGGVALPPVEVENTLGEVVSWRGRQLRISETEKYAHVTFFLNNGRIDPFPGEDRVLVPSPKVETYDRMPEMSSAEVTAALMGKLDEDYILYVVNFANPDMVGHSGNVPATVKAIEAVDGCLGRIAEAVLARGGDLLITADHGNADQMMEHGEVRTAHSLNKVPFIAAGPDCECRRARDGELSDIAPTVLALLGLDIPSEMTGRPLLVPLP